MRIIIESDQDIVVDQGPVGPGPAGENIHDGGPAPAEMLRRLGHEVPDIDLQGPDIGRRGAKDQAGEETLNPLRAGEARARARLDVTEIARDVDAEMETEKGGPAPKVRASRKKTPG